MNRTPALILVSVVFLLAACDGRNAVEPVVPQEVALARIDPDAALADKVEKALGTDNAPLAYGIEVTAQNGIVDLWGTVDSTAARKRFELIAAGVVGVKSLQSHLKVDPGA